jgi:uncharacterized membrane protein
LYFWTQANSKEKDHSVLSTPAGTVKNAQFSRVEITLLLTLLIFGLSMIILIPLGAGYDEEDHLLRVWELSAASFLPGQLPPQEMKYPTLFRDLAYRQQANSGIIDSDFWKTYAQTPLYENGSVRRELKTKSVYSPALLLPQAIVMRLGRSANLPALPVLYACRLASLLSYLSLVWLALRWIPFGKWLLFVLAASPMALFQAATITPDAISNGIGFLFIAGILKLAGSKEIDWKKFGTLVLLIFLLFLAKVNLTALVLLPFLLIPPARFTQRRIYVLLLGTTVLLLLLEVAGWNIIATSHSNALLANNADAGAQLRYILDHPLIFPTILLKDPFLNGWAYLQGWINGYGYLYWTPPQIVSVFFLLSLGAVLFSESTSAQVSRKDQIIFLLVFLGGYLATAVPLYLTFTTVGLNQLLGVQGRYFIPLALLPVLVLASILAIKQFTVPSHWTIIFLSAALSLNIAGIILAFYVPCGTTFYQTGLCYRPLYKDFSNETHLSQPISKDMALAQGIKVSCDGFSELQVLLTPSGSNDQGATRFILQNPKSGQTLFDTSILNNQISAETWVPLRFKPDWHSAGKTYLLRISGGNTLAGQGPRLLYTPQSEFNLGDLFENGQPLKDDLVLQYGCATGLQKIWLTGKP